MSALHIQIYTAVAPRLVKCNNHSTPTHKLIFFLSLSVFKCEQNSENKDSGGLIRGESFMGEWSLWRKSKLRRIDGKSQRPSQGPATRRPQILFGELQCRVNRKAMQTPWLRVSGGDGNYQQYHQSFDDLQFTKCFLWFISLSSHCNIDKTTNSIVPLFYQLKMGDLNGEVYTLLFSLWNWFCWGRIKISGLSVYSV